MSMSKKLVAEFIGTFWLVLGGCGSAVLAAAGGNGTEPLSGGPGGERIRRAFSRALPTRRGVSLGALIYRFTAASALQTPDLDKA
jgi:glycerol uptake facilitator-like aquaporin